MISDCISFKYVYLALLHSDIPHSDCNFACVLAKLFIRRIMRSQQETHIPVEWLSGSVERVTFHREESGFCVLRVKVKGHRELVTVIGSAASITPGEFVECQGVWNNDKT